MSLTIAFLSCSSGVASKGVPHRSAADREAKSDPDAASDPDGQSVRHPLPFAADPGPARKAVEALDVNSSLGDWRAVGPRTFGGKVYSAAVDPFDGAKVYAAYEVGGLWGTRDGGQTWLPMFNGRRDIAFASVKTSLTVRGLVAAGLIAYGGGYSRSLNRDVGIVLSRDGGTTWRNIGPRTDLKATVWEVGFGDTTGQTIYAPTDRGLYKTTDQGRSWALILRYSGTDFFLDRPSFAVDPLNRNTLLLAQRTVGVMRSTDGGRSWSRVDSWVNPATTAQNPTLLAWSSTSTVVAEAYTNGKNETLSTYRSGDEGATWTATATTNLFNQGTYDMAIAVDPFDGNHVLIHNTCSQYSTDALQTVQQVDAQNCFHVSGPDALAVAFDPSHRGVVYDGNDEGLWKSVDGGINWGRFDIGVLTTKALGGSAYAVGTDGSIYTNPADYAGQQYISGSGWVERPDGYEYSRYYVNPHDPNDLYRYGAYSNTGYGQDFYRAPTASHAAQNIDPAPRTGPSQRLAVEFDPVDPNTVYLGKRYLYKSVDRGTSWTYWPSVGTGAISLVKVAHSNPKHIYAVSNSQIWSTVNGGTSWQTGATVPRTRMISVSPTAQNTVYIASGSGLFQSTDGGKTVDKLPGVPSVNLPWVVVDPSVPTRIYAATNSTVLVSQDRGTTWRRLGSQLPLTQVDWMTIAGRNLYAGTNAGVWEITLEH